MSTKERRRLEIFAQVRRGEISVGRAARLAGVSARQAKRIWKRYKRDGDAGLVHGLRGRPGNAELVQRLPALTFAEQPQDFDRTKWHGKLLSRQR
jgi:transposase